MADAIVTFVNAVQFANNIFPRVVVLEGIEISFTTLLPPKACWPILESVDGKSKLSTATPLNAAFPILVRLVGMLIDLSPEQDANA